MSFLLVPLYSRRLSEAENGLMGIAFAFIAFAGIIYTLGLNQALLRYFGGPEEEAEQRRTFSSALVTVGIVSAALSIGIWAGAGQIADLFFGEQGLGRFIRMASVILFIDALSGVPLNALRALERPGAYAGIKFSQFTLALLLNVVLIVYAGRGLDGVFESNILSSAFALVCCLPVMCRYLRPVLSFEALKRMLAFGLPYIPSVMAVLVIDVSDRYLVRRFAGLDEAGVYNIVYKFGMVMALATAAFRSAWLPFFLSLSRREDGRPICARMMTYFLAAGVALCMAVTLFLDEIVGRMAGPSFLRGKWVVPVVLASYLTYGLYVNLMAGVYVKERTRILPGIVGLGAGINLLLNLLLIPRLGMMGAAWSTLAAYVAMATLLFVFEQGFYPVDYEWMRMGKILSAGVVLAAAGAWIGPSAGLAGILFRVLMLMAYPLILWALRVLARDEMDRLGEIFRRRATA